MILFFASNIYDTIYTFNPEESRHIARVLRLKTGDIVYITDGKGNLHKAKILNADQKQCSVSIVESQKNFGQRSFNLHLAVAPTKNLNRYEWFIEKAVETGIEEITPIICEHSERRHLKVERLEKIAIAALKQSLKAKLPLINEPIPFDRFIKMKHTGQTFMAHLDENCFHLKDRYKRDSDAIVLIGPEGDFSEREIELAKEHNFEPIILSHQRLRTETAAIHACTIMNVLND